MPFLLCLLTSIAISKIIAQQVPAPVENLDDSSKYYIKQFTNTINGELTYKSPVFFAIGEKNEQLIIQINTTSAKDHIKITFLAKDLDCSTQGQNIAILMDEDHSTTLVNALPSNCRNMQAAVMPNTGVHLHDFSTDQSEIMFFGFLKIKSFTLTEGSTFIKYHFDNQSAEKFRTAYKCFERLIGMWN